MKKNALERYEPTNVDYLNDDMVENEIKLTLEVHGADISIHAHCGEMLIKAYELLKNILDDDTTTQKTQRTKNDNR